MFYNKKARSKKKDIRQEKDVVEESGVILSRERRKVIKEAHQGATTSKEATALGSHRGRDRTYNVLRFRYSWPLMYNDVEEYCSTCFECQIYNPSMLKIKDELHPVPIPKRVMSQIGIDLSHMPKSKGMEYMVLAVDYFTKWVEGNFTESSFLLSLKWKKDLVFQVSQVRAFTASILQLEK